VAIIAAFYPVRRFLMTIFAFKFNVNFVENQSGNFVVEVVDRPDAVAAFAFLFQAGKFTFCNVASRAFQIGMEFGNVETDSLFMIKRRLFDIRMAYGARIYIFGIVTFAAFRMKYNRRCFQSRFINGMAFNAALVFMTVAALVSESLVVLFVIKSYQFAVRKIRSINFFYRRFNFRVNRFFLFRFIRRIFLRACRGMTAYAFYFAAPFAMA
jgi:hypothetical protein